MMKANTEIGDLLAKVEKNVSFKPRNMTAGQY